MLISHRHKLVFIKTRKVGGTSFEKYFMDNHFNFQGDVCTGSIINNILPCNTTLKGHVPWDVILREYPEAEFYKKFSIERNPWDKCVSLYYFYKAEGRYFADNASFSDFISHRELLPQDLQQYINAPNLTVVLWERLAEELEEVLASVGIQFDRNKFASYQLKAGHRRDTHYSHLYSDEDVEIVRSIFTPQIELFNYDFEDQRKLLG